MDSRGMPCARARGTWGVRDDLIARAVAADDEQIA